MADGKRCAKCAETKPTTEFGPGKRWGDGLFPYCRECKRQIDRDYRKQNGDMLRAKSRERYAANPEPAKARHKARYQADPDRANRATADWQRRNPEKRKATSRKWQQANMQGSVREATRRRYATRKGAPALLFTPQQLAQRSAYYGDRCWICRGDSCEWDHVIPLSKGGWHALSNLRPICRPCNASKSDRWPWPPVGSPSRS